MSSNTRERGIALIAVVFTLALLMGLVATMAVSLNMDTQLRGAFGHNVTGFYAAESGLNKGMGEFKNLFLDFRVPTGSDFSARTSTMGTRSVSYALTERSGNPRTHTIPTGELFGGLNTTEYTYTVTSQANSVNGDNEASVGAEFLVGNIPIFQFVAFYARDLEILPGAEMHLHGRVHTNGSLYLNSDAAIPSGTPPAGPNVTLGGGFFIEDAPVVAGFPAPGITNIQVSAKGNLYRGRKNNNSCNGAVYVAKLGDSNSDNRNDPRIINCVGGATSIVPVSSLSAWQGSIVTQLESISVPQPDLADKNGAYWQHADLRIVLKLNAGDSLQDSGCLVAACPGLPHTIEVQDASGARDAALTSRLHTFMMDGAWNLANSAYKGTMPIFYSDRPAAGCNCTDTNAVGCANQPNTCWDIAPGHAANFQAPTGAANALNFTRAYSPYMNRQPITGWPTGTAFAPPFDGIYRRGGFYNHRERQWMYLLNINIGDLLAWNQAQPAGSQLFTPGNTTNGGLIIYATVEDADDPNPVDPFNNYGVRLFGGRNLNIPVAADPTGLTFVTEQPVYVLGDYNGSTNAAGASVAGALPWQPAAIIADSVNVLSNDWFNRTVPVSTNGATECINDCQSIAALGSNGRRANHTTYNVAFLGGVDDTNGSAYNGGLENYPRFHESWSSRNMNYRGSFVSLGVPVHANGAWPGTGGIFYNPPIRNFDYDARFNDAKNLPPDTPRFVYVQQVLFTEDFK